MDIKSYESHVPPKDELVASLGQGLKSYFADVTVELVECPDFNKHPFKMPIDGLNGKPTIVDVGGGMYQFGSSIVETSIRLFYKLTFATSAQPDSASQSGVALQLKGCY